MWLSVEVYVLAVQGVAAAASDAACYPAVHCQDDRWFAVDDGMLSQDHELPGGRGGVPFGRHQMFNPYLIISSLMASSGLRLSRRGWGMLHHASSIWASLSSKSSSLSPSSCLTVMTAFLISPRRST